MSDLTVVSDCPPVPEDVFAMVWRMFIEIGDNFDSLEDATEAVAKAVEGRIEAPYQISAMRRVRALVPILKGKCSRATRHFVRRNSVHECVLMTAATCSMKDGKFVQSVFDALVQSNWTKWAAEAKTSEAVSDVPSAIESYKPIGSYIKATEQEQAPVVVSSGPRKGWPSPLNGTASFRYGFDNQEVEKFASMFPDIFAKLYPRTYPDLGQYYSPRLIAAALGHVIADVRRTGVDKSYTAYRLMLPAFDYLIRHRMPLFFLSPDLLAAVRQTNFAEDVEWTTLKIPFEHGIFVLPKGALRSPQDGEVAFLFWSHAKPGLYKGVFGTPNVEVPEEGFSITAFCPATGAWFDTHLTATYRPSLRIGNLFYRNTPTDLEFMDHDVPLTENESEFIEEIGRIVFGTFLALNARPALLEPEKLDKVVKRSDGTRKEFWHPNVIGKNYRIQRAPQGGTHASPRLHWRRGHFRSQPVGFGRKERRTIWIEPCLIGAGKEQQVG